MITNEQRELVRLYADDQLVGRYIDFLIKLAPQAPDPFEVMDRIEVAIRFRDRLLRDLEAALDPSEMLPL